MVKKFLRMGTANIALSPSCCSEQPDAVPPALLRA
eukprot:CAMPEP_0179406486 /NCGR_PEP_ID=MMETSP0799-20121207/919_1 /TAXON_ID=46947 /ORGANISM="Geminigera cryophila, Strain CCMP2564" /LENGTH=34 /DNA_ID= /DNA_START= /DNA_END= /DNA_ORIENTATION=